ncbi:unnamed protein product, partial [Porites evermanni]
MEVYQRPENLRFFGIKEEADMEEDVREVLLKGKNFGISPDLPSEILERRKKKMKQFKQAKKDGKTAFFSRAEPDKLFIDGV